MSSFRFFVPLMAGALACRAEPTGVDPGAARLLSTVSAAVALSRNEALGRLVFFDTRLSGGAIPQACAACHDPNAGWTGPLSAINEHGAVYEGSVPGRFGNRKPPSSAYATLSPIFHLETDRDDQLFEGGNFWDGRATGEQLGNPAADQALGPFLNPVEQALTSGADVVRLVCDGPYASVFTEVWGAGACEPGNAAQSYGRIGLSIAAFEGSVESNAFTSKFDAYRAHRVNLTPEEHRGFALFVGKAKCAGCHVTGDEGGGRALFTDFTFDNIGTPKNPENPWYGMSAFNPEGANWRDPGLGGFLTTRPEYQALAQENMGKHKVPTLRNVDLRPWPGFVKAYTHNGYFKSLESLVHFYNTRDVLPTCPGDYTEAQALVANCWPLPEVAANVNRTELGDLRLSAREEQAIVAFMRALSDGYRP
jgi:cytochrome c peroxidase